MLITSSNNGYLYTANAATLGSGIDNEATKLMIRGCPVGVVEVLFHNDANFAGVTLRPLSGNQDLTDLAGSNKAISSISFIRKYCPISELPGDVFPAIDAGQHRVWDGQQIPVGCSTAVATDREPNPIHKYTATCAATYPERSAVWSEEKCTKGCEEVGGMYISSTATAQGNYFSDEQCCEVCSNNPNCTAYMLDTGANYQCKITTVKPVKVQFEAARYKLGTKGALDPGCSLLLLDSVASEQSSIGYLFTDSATTMPSDIKGKVSSYKFLSKCQDTEVYLFDRENYKGRHFGPLSNGAVAMVQLNGNWENNIKSVLFKKTYYRGSELPNLESRLVPDVDAVSKIFRKQQSIKASCKEGLTFKQLLCNSGAFCDYKERTDSGLYYDMQWLGEGCLLNQNARTCKCK